MQNMTLSVYFIETQTESQVKAEEPVQFFFNLKGILHFIETPTQCAGVEMERNSWQ